MTDEVKLDRPPPVTGSKALAPFAPGGKDVFSVKSSDVGVLTMVTIRAVRLTRVLGGGLKGVGVGAQGVGVGLQGVGVGVVQGGRVVAGGMLCRGHAI